MTRLSIFLASLSVCAFVSSAAAQQPSPRIGPYVVDVHLALPRFPQEQSVADSRGLVLAQLPGTGMGLQIAAQVYPLRYRAVTFGFGGDLTVGAAHSAAAETGPGEPAIPGVTERLTTISPQVSFNFGGKNGWSYISGGVGVSRWSVIPEGAASLPADDESLRTLNYGAGARWLTTRRVGFSFDVRFYAIREGSPQGSLPPSPRRTLLSIAAGISIR